MSTAGRRCTPIARLLLILFIVSFLFSPSYAGGKRRLLHSNIVVQEKPKIETSVDRDDGDAGDAGDAGVASRRHGRVLRVPADDYARYDPSPTMNKPHFKDIPN